jgi:hypothetical protein
MYLAVMVWLQGNVLALNLGVINGRPIAWEEFQVPLILHMIIWLVIAWLFYVQRTHHKRLTMPIGLILLGMQTVNGFNHYVTFPPLPQFIAYTTDAYIPYTFSKTKNVVMIVLDTFQADIFEEVLRLKPDLLPALEGFTYYQNTAGGFQATYPSVPLIMTGKYYQNQQPLEAFVREAYLDDSIPKNLKEAGYSVSINCNPFMFCDEQTSDAFIKNRPQQWLTRKDLRTLYKPTVLRYAPGLLLLAYQQVKIGITQATPIDFPPFDETRDYFETDQRLLTEIINKSQVNSDQPVFRYYHFIAPHPPFYLNPEGSYQPQDHNRSGFIHHSAGAFTQAEKVLQKLKELHIYDQTMIVIISDHGYELGFKPDLDGEIIENPIVSAALPLFMVKPFQAKHDFLIQKEPVSLASFKADLMSYLDTYKISEYAPYTPTISNNREFYHYDWQAEWPAGYLPTLTRYTVGDDVRSLNSWSHDDFVGY